MANPGLTLRRMREDAKLTLEEASRRLRDARWEVSFGQLAKLETGAVQNIKLYDAAALAELYHLTLDDIAALYGITPQRTTKTDLDPYLSNILHQVRNTLTSLPPERRYLLAALLANLATTYTNVPVEA